MAKIFKFTAIMVDVNNDFETIEEFIDYINNKNRYSDLITFEEKTSKEFEWHDDIDINLANSKLEDYNKYFKDE